jgi:tetraacyldisaccharide 4'-kinase
LRANAAIAVAGIARPERFFEMLRREGQWDVKATLAFADHHRYTTADIERIAEAARAAHATIVLTTAKDAVRFEALGRLPFVLNVIPLRLDIDGWDALVASIEQAVERARGGA